METRHERKEKGPREQTPEGLQTSLDARLDLEPVQAGRLVHNLEQKLEVAFFKPFKQIFF